jgi:hypothetical protein
MSRVGVEELTHWGEVPAGVAPEIRIGAHRAEGNDPADWAEQNGCTGKKNGEKINTSRFVWYTVNKGHSARGLPTASSTLFPENDKVVASERIGYKSFLALENR